MILVAIIFWIVLSLIIFGNILGFIDGMRGKCSSENRLNIGYWFGVLLHDILH